MRNKQEIISDAVQFSDMMDKPLVITLSGNIEDEWFSMKYEDEDYIDEATFEYRWRENWDDILADFEIRVLDHKNK